MDLRARLGLEHPVVQAGMGGGLAGAELAGAVSAAGALGTVGMVAPGPFAAALQTARRRAPGRPVAANLLVPFIRRSHVEACINAQASMVVFHGGLPQQRWLTALRAARVPVFVTVGTADQARRAVAAGGDGLVVQGIEAGGHLLGVETTELALVKVLDVAGDVPVLAAGGIADAADVRRVLAAGAAGAVAGTRFLLTDESQAHPAYKQRVLGAERTINTLLFGVGWPMRHRVVPNAATERWCRAAELGPGWVRGASRLSAPVGRAVPLSALGRLVAVQRVGVPLFSPAPPLADMPAHSVEQSALYAGQTSRRIQTIVPAQEAVAALVG